MIPGMWAVTLVWLKNCKAYGGDSPCKPCLKQVMRLKFFRDGIPRGEQKRFLEENPELFAETA